MNEIKTKQVVQDVHEFLMSVEPDKKRNDCIDLKKLFDSVLKEQASIWNNNMIGYGKFHYKSDRSRQEGDWPLISFSPRKQNITIYIMSGANNYKNLLAELGKFKMSTGSCIYINKLEDINPEVLKKIIIASVSDMKVKYKIA
jgi:hypothetical protein